MGEASLIDGREGYASCTALQGIVRYRSLASRRCSATFDRSAHSRGVGCPPRWPAPASLSALSPGAREAGLLLGL